jgi:hypothetical protein
MCVYVCVHVFVRSNTFFICFSFTDDSYICMYIVTSCTLGVAQWSSRPLQHQKIVGSNPVRGRGF